MDQAAVGFLADLGREAEGEGRINREWMEADEWMEGEGGAGFDASEHEQKNSEKKVWKMHRKFF